MHFPRSLLALSVAALLAMPLPATASPAAPAPLSLGEQFIVRAYAGQLEALAVSNVIKAKTLGIAVNNSTICVALAGSLAGGFVASNKDDGLAAAKAGEKPVRRLDIVAYNQPSDATNAVASFKDKDAIALLFGGQVSEADNYASVRNTLVELAKVDYSGAIFLHLTVAAKKWVEKAATEDKAVAAYLAKKNNVYALAVNVELKKGLVNQLSFKDGKQNVAKAAFETALNDGFLDLFKRRLIAPVI
ncbi:MAG: hypothetical protein Q8Q28_00730 [Pseudomonadota bacterium]|nr:hypothetical protein [Pseudomonadota bacterium]